MAHLTLTGVERTRAIQLHYIAMREARGKTLTDEATQQIVNELKPKHPAFAAVIERGHQLDMRETLAALIVFEALKRFLRIHAARLATD